MKKVMKEPHFNHVFETYMIFLKIFSYKFMPDARVSSRRASEWTPETSLIASLMRRRPLLLQELFTR